MGKKTKLPKGPTIGIPQMKKPGKHFAAQPKKAIVVTKGPMKMKLLTQAKTEMGAASHPHLVIPPMKRNTKKYCL